MPLLPKKGGVGRRVLTLPIAAIRPNPDQPRRAFDPAALAELADSIRAMGILQPLTVRRTDDGWELVAGERRLRAAALAGLTTVPCLPLQTDGRTSSLLALVENLQRRDLDFWEEAQALDRLIRSFCLSQEEVARRIGKSRSAVANKLRLLRLPPEVLELLRQSDCTERHARALLRLEGDPRLPCAAEHVTRGKLNVAQTERYVDSLLSPGAAPRRPRAVKDVRSFLSTVSRGLALMRSSGVDARLQRRDLPGDICLTIRIPR